MSATRRPSLQPPISTASSTGSSTSSYAGPAPAPSAPAACINAEAKGPCCLHELKAGCAGCVTAVGGDRDLRRRLLEMGFCNGARVEMLRRAPLGDPIEFSLRGYCVSLRSEQARHVQLWVSEATNG